MENTQIEYQDYPDFNSYLDENYEVAIGIYNFNASEVLYKMNYDRYVDALTAYNAEPEVVTRRIYERFPSPIAYHLYEVEENYQNEHHRLDSLKSCWESIVFTVFGLTVGEAYSKQIGLKQISGINYSDYWSDKLGKKLEIVEKIIDFALTNGFALEILKIISLDTVGKIRRLNRERNGFEHAAAKTSAQQDILFNELFPLVKDVLKELMGLEKVELIRYYSQEQALFPRCEIFNGHNIIGIKKYVRISETTYLKIFKDWNKSSIFAKINDELFCVSPFIHFYQEAHETNPLICFFKKEKAGVYFFEVTSKSTDYQFNKTVFTDIENKLRAEII